MFLIVWLSLASSGSSFTGEDVLADVIGWLEGSGALPVRRASDVSDGGTDGLAGADNALEE